MKTTMTGPNLLTNSRLNQGRIYRQRAGRLRAARFGVGGVGSKKPSRTTARSNQVRPRCETWPLNRVEAGVAVRIKKLCALPDIQIRLRELGFREEQIMRLLTTRTNYICLVCNTRLALSPELAELILVEPLQPFDPGTRAYLRKTLHAL